MMEECVSHETQPVSSGKKEEKVIVPKPAYVVTPPNLSSATYKQFKSSQPLTATGRASTKKRTPHMYGEMPNRYQSQPPPHSHHYQHQYYSPPPPPKKRISQNINTPRFGERPPSPRPGPDQYHPLPAVTGPSYSFGHKLGEKDEGYGHGRTSWEKAWFATNDVWKIKTNFEDKWPEVGSHDYQMSCLGRRLPHLPCGPSPSFGIKLADNVLCKRKKEPSPNEYDTALSVRHQFKAAPKFTMVRKDYSYEPWVKNKNVPGPGKYAPNIPAVKPRTPAFAFAKPSPNYTVVS